MHRIGILDPVSASRKFAYQVVRRLGCTPVGFTELHAFKNAESHPARCDMLVVSCDRNVELSAQLLASARELLRPHELLIFITRPDSVAELRVQHAHHGDIVIAAPSSLFAMRDFLRRASQIENSGGDAPRSLGRTTHVCR